MSSRSDATGHSCHPGVLWGGMASPGPCRTPGSHSLCPAGLHLLSPPCHLHLSPIPALLSPCSWAHSGLFGPSLHARLCPRSRAGLALRPCWVFRVGAVGLGLAPRGCSRPVPPAGPSTAPANLGLLCHSHPWSFPALGVHLGSHRFVGGLLPRSTEGWEVGKGPASPSPVSFLPHPRGCQRLGAFQGPRKEQIYFLLC